MKLIKFSQRILVMLSSNHRLHINIVHVYPPQCLVHICFSELFFFNDVLFLRGSVYFFEINWNIILFIFFLNASRRFKLWSVKLRFVSFIHYILFALISDHIIQNGLFFSQAFFIFKISTSFGHVLFFGSLIL